MLDTISVDMGEFCRFLFPNSVMLLLLIFFVELLLVVLYNHTMCIFNVQSHTVFQKIYHKTLFTVIYVHVGHNLG